MPRWHCVLLKRVLTHAFVFVYHLDWTQQELVQKTLTQPLMEQFRKLLFQAVPAQLAGQTLLVLFFLSHFFNKLGSILDAFGFIFTQKLVPVLKNYIPMRVLQ